MLGNETNLKIELMEARVGMFTEMIDFAETQFKTLRTIEWEEAIYYKNMILTPMMMGPKEERLVAGNRRDLVMTTIG